MKETLAFAAVFIVLSTATATSVATAQTTRINPVVVGSTVGIPGVVADSVDIVRILEGFSGLDDPIGLTDGSLLFSEPGGLRIHRLDPATGEVTVLVAESNESHGVTEDASGRLISAQAWDGSTRIGVIYPPQRVATLADNYRGQPFSRPNDVIVAKSGSVYFTDPGLTAGQEQELIERYNGRPLEPRLPPTVYHIPPGGEAIAIESDMIRPNGIQLSRDERTLYIADSNGAHLIAWDIRADGSVMNRREFGTLYGRSPRNNGLGGVRTYGDGMAVDADGRIYVATGMGVEVLSPDGANLGSIPVRCVPADCQNLAFGGPSKQTLYIAGAGSLYRVQMLTRGLPDRAK